jgi:hypothetical protein
MGGLLIFGLIVILKNFRLKMSQDENADDSKKLSDSKGGFKGKLVNVVKLVDKNLSGLNHRDSLDSGRSAGDRLSCFDFEKGEEAFLNQLLFPPLISVMDRKKNKDYFFGKLAGCPDQPNNNKWSDIKPDKFCGGGEGMNVVLDSQLKVGSVTVFNLYFRASHVFQEFIFDLGYGFPETNIFAFTGRGAYLREKEGRWEGWARFTELKKEEGDGIFGDSYAIEDAYPKNLEALLEEGERKGDGGQWLKNLLWSADRMAPFEIRSNIEHSRIITGVFTPRNGVGYKKENKNDIPDVNDEDYMIKMSLYEARQLMYELTPLYPVDVITLAERIKKGLRERN